MTRKFARPFRTPIRTGGYSMPPTTMAVTHAEDAWKLGEVLYHYTSFSAFQKICGSREIFMSECVSASDTEEIVLSAEVMYTDIMTRYKDHPLCKFALQGIDQFVNAIPNGIFALSLTEDPDLLSQWRGYGGNDGIVLGFNLRLLKDICVSNGINMGRVIYNPLQQDSMMVPVSDLYMRAYELGEGASREACQWDFWQKYLNVAPLIKHVAFAEEREWRLFGTIMEGDVYGKDKNYKYLNDRRYVTLKIESKLYCEDFLLSDIVIGPSKNWSKRFDEVELILNKSDIKCRRIWVSTTPYQPLR